MPIPPRHAGRLSARTAVILALAALLAAGEPASRALADDVVVLTNRAFKPVLLDLAPGFLARTGNTLAISSDTTGGVTARIVRGEEIDLVIVTAAALDAVAAQGKVAAGSVAPVAKSGIGIVVKKGAPLPDISSVEAFKRTMLAAPSFAYTDPESGDLNAVWLAKLFDRLGIADAIRRNAVLVPGGLTASRVDDGEATLALQQISELHAVSGVAIVGPLPEEIQRYTVYAAAIPAAARRPAAGRALLAYLRSEAAVPALTARGFEHP
jgi:molybdate transport system substrate-binding protein